MKQVGRFIVRPNKEVGVYLNLSDGLEPGLYDIVEVFGELTVKRLEDF